MAVPAAKATASTAATAAAATATAAKAAAAALVVVIKYKVSLSISALWLLAEQAKNTPRAFRTPMGLVAIEQAGERMRVRSLIVFCSQLSKAH